MTDVSFGEECTVKGCLVIGDWRELLMINRVYFRPQKIAGCRAYRYELHSSPKETQVFGSCISLGEDCMPLDLGSYTHNPARSILVNKW